MMHRMHSLSALAGKRATLLAGAVFVAMVGCEESHCRFIGHTLAHHL